MTILALVCPREAVNFVSADLYEAGTLGIVEEDVGYGRFRLQAYFDDAPAGLMSRFSGFDAELHEAENVNWVAISQSHWEPLFVGERFFLVPSWRDDPAPAGRLRLVMPPGTASGTGLHAATQLALQGLERCLQPGERVMDLGTGSGILAAASRLLGAGTVFACDIDGDAVLAAHSYLGPDTALFTGSCRSLRDASVDVVVANLNAPALAAAGSDIARVVRPGGRVVLSGFTQSESARVTRLAGLSVREALADGEWSAAIMEKAV